MSAIKSKRGVSKLEYLDTAFYLQEFVADRARKLFATNNPLSIVTANMLITLAMDVTNETKVASLDEFKDTILRMEALQKAYASLHKLVSQINQAHLQFHFTDSVMLEWMELVDREDTLLRVELGFPTDTSRITEELEFYGFHFTEDFNFIK